MPSSLNELSAAAIAKTTAGSTCLNGEDADMDPMIHDTSRIKDIIIKDM